MSCRNALERLAGLFRDRLIDAFARLDDLARLNRDVGGVAAEPAGRLVNQEARVGQRVAVLFRRRQIDVRGNRTDPTGADRAHHGLDEADDVVNGVAGLDVSARRTDEDRDRRVAFERQRQQFFGGALCNLFVDLAEDRHRAVLQQRVLEKVELLGGVGGYLFAVQTMTGRIHDRLLLT